ncbi:MAG: hypothetical protein ABJH93_16610, partial [Roseibium sp.]|uniref:hypothetical protein n=1 Tax=Roseibium sp. TaxID=1936156 RepID=UPI003297BDB4
MHVSFAVRPGSFFVQRMLVSMGTPRKTAGADYACHLANTGWRVVVGLEFHEDLEFWPSFVAEGLDVRRNRLSAPLHHLLQRPARRTLFMDASITAVGGLCLELAFTGFMSSIPP